MCLDCVFCPPRGSGQETDLWHTGTRSHWGGQYIWLHWGRACWSSRLCRSDTRHRWTLEGTDTEGNQELLEAAHPHSCTVRNYLPANLPSHPNRSSANLHAMASSSTHKHTTSQTWLLIQPTLQRFCFPGQRSLSLKTEMAKPNRNKADGAQVVDSMPVCKTESPPIKIFEAIKAKNKTTE